MSVKASSIGTVFDFSVIVVNSIFFRYLGDRPSCQSIHVTAKHPLNKIMLNSKRTIPTLFFLFIALAGSAQIVDNELENHRKKTKDVFIQLIPEISDKLSDSTLSFEQQSMLFDPMFDYAEKEQSTYKRIRQKYLKQVPAPPETLSNIPFDSLENSDIVKMLHDSKFTTVSLLQSYKPIEIGANINGMVQPYIYQSSGVGLDEASIAYAFGRQVFARNLQGDDWQIWFVNRAYVSRFSLNLQNMTVSKLEYTVPNVPGYLKIQQPFIPYKQRFETDKLYQAMDEVRWNAYSMDLLKESSADSWQDTVRGRLHAFYTQNQQRFIKSQEEILKGLAKGSELDSQWEHLQNLSDEESEPLKKILEPTILSPDEAAYLLFSVTNGIFPFRENVNEIGKNAMAGFQHSLLSKEGNEIWRIQSKGFSIAFEYKWNIKTGTFSDLKIFNREK